MREHARAQRPPAPPARRREPLLPTRSGLSPPPERPALLVEPAPAAPPPEMAVEVAEAPPTEEVLLEVAEAAPPEVELIIPPPPPDLESRTQARASRATSRMGATGTANQTLPAPDEDIAAARANVDEPTEETTSRAQGAIAATLREQPQPSPEIEQLCADIQDAIQNRRPPDEDSLRRTDPAAEAQAVGDALNDDISEDGDRVSGEYAGVNDPATGEPTQVSAPLPETPREVSAPEVNAASVTPPAAMDADVNLDEDARATAARIEEANIDNDVTREIPTPPFSDAREGMTELEQVAAEDPARVLQEQEEAIAASRGEMRQVEARAIAALEASRGTTVDGALTQQIAMAGSEEEQRIAAARAAETIFTTAQTAVNDLLTPMVPAAMSLWNTGKERIATAFDNELQRAKEMVDERHEGIGGAIVSIWDDVTGLPSSITNIYTSAERTFGRDICTLIREVSTYVNGIVIACEEIIDKADRDIAELFRLLPDNLQDWASQQQAGFQGRLDTMRDNVHDTQQNFTNDLVTQAGDAVQEARERIDALREAAKGLIQKVADAIEAFIDDPVRAIINGLLTVVGIAPGAFWALLAQIEEVASDIADDPINFANNLLSAVGLGFSNFFDNFFGHLMTGFINWLFSAMGTVGVQLPPDTSLKSIITFFLQLMGLTWPNIRIILVRHIGEQNVELIEKAYELLTLLIEEGPGGIFEMIKERLDPAAILNTIIEAAVSYMVETIVSIATVWILGLFNPAGAILQAIEAIYKVLKWIFENAARIFTLVQTIVGGVADLIAGNIAGMAAKTEQALAGLLVPVIDFIAGFLGLGDLPEKIAEVVGGFQAVVLEAVDRAIGFLVEQARGLLAALGIGGEDEEDGGDEGALEDTEVGKEFRFSSDGEGHRLWIDSSGGLDVMVASTPTKLDVKIRDWIARVEERPVADRNTIRGLLTQASAKLDLTLTEAEQAQLAIVDALTVEEGEDAAADRAVAEQQDAEAEAKEGELVPILTQLFEYYGETSLIVLYTEELGRSDSVAQPDITTQVTEREDSYAAFQPTKNWPGFQGALVEGPGTIKSLHEAPLGTDALERPWQARNFTQIFVAGLNLALPIARAERATPPTDAQLMGPNTTPEAFARARRRTIHRREAPPGESGAVALGQPLRDELQRMLLAGGSIGQAVNLAKDYFAETLKLSAEHQEYKIDPPPVPRIEHSKLVIDYSYRSAADPAAKTFTVSVGMPDINGQMFEHVVVGDNLVTKAPGTRGQLTVTTSEGGQIEHRDERIRLERSHLIADWFQGTGYRDGLNIIHTSRDFNQVNMKNIEIQLAQNLSNWENQYPGYPVNMRLTVRATYEVLDHQQTANKVRDLITAANAAEIADRRAEIAQQLFDILRGKQEMRLCDNITYSAEIYLGNHTLLDVLPILETGPDEMKTESL
ncbi:DNA/RNA non-specific endonuclease [Lewinella sp. JB7]|uniref:DNA/RNA non-specific endonuclease n=1 Tax=Lewinella sp. JB7 TaxID=2962887 RepID=UPI0020C9BD79|nr:DNA/RNA non-specific endonuclease [Lewinella sp. JB7]MCP9234650.1 DNA/RNA non-specific endonuclease [Lewinella sp. JB7]